ncbi:MAG: hypothetical protein R2762_18320 [Bryobacteraceae bacterium]
MSLTMRLAGLSLISLAAAIAAEGIEGLWEVESVRNVTTGKMQPKVPEYHMYTATHEMIILAGANRPKLKKSLSDMTPEEVKSQQPVGAGLYRYRVEGRKLIRTNLKALSAYYEGRVVETEFELSGDKLVVRDRHSADGNLREWTMRRVRE